MFRKIAELLGVTIRTEVEVEAESEDISVMRKETIVMEENPNKMQARQENAPITSNGSTANVVEMLTSILDQVKRQQSTQTTQALEGDALTAVEIFREIDIALGVEPQNVGIGGGAGTRRRQGRR